MNWERTLDRYGTLIEERLEDYFVEVLKDAKGYHSFIEKVYSDLEEFVLRKGKRLASCSTLLTYKGYTGKVDDESMHAYRGFRHIKPLKHLLDFPIYAATYPEGERVSPISNQKTT